MRKVIVLAALIGIIVFSGCIEGETPQVNETENQTPVEVEEKECFGPVCGVDGVTYDTDCLAGEMGVAVAHMGECEEPVLCEDSDGGLNISVRGNVSKGNESHTDYCEDGKLYEYSCSENEIMLSTLNCPNGTFCEEGACMEIAPENETNETVELVCDGPAEADIYTKETVVYEGVAYEDVCVTATVVKDYYCENESMKSINHECTGAYECRNGACTEMPKICEDSDDGIDLQKRGNIMVIRGINTIFDEFDDCIDEGTIKEWHCAENGSAIYEELWCGDARKCKDGRCIRSNCTDSDFGKNVTVEGEVEANGNEEEDYCVNDHTVMEYFCYGESIRGEEMDCPEGYSCISGECMED